MSVLADLRSATWPSHQQLEKRMGIKQRFTELDAYHAHLQRMWGFCAGIEQLLMPASFGGALRDCERRRKLPFLSQDLVALGTDAKRIALLPRCAMLAIPSEPAAAFGCAYVMEGATLGGRTLLPLVHERLGLTADRGAAFLASYRNDVPAMWHDFCAALESWCCTPARRESAVQSAVATFEALSDWLCGTSP